MPRPGTRGPVLIIGGASDIGRAIAHRYARAGHPIQLAARAVERLEEDRADIAVRHDVPVSLHALDILDTASFDSFVRSLPELPHIAVCVVGLLGDQAAAEVDSDTAARVMRSNFEGPALLMGVLAYLFAARGSGTLIGISSVAGDRGRASNYVYGSAKAGFTAFLSGLRNRMASKGVHVMTVLPGFVATQMTAGMDLPPLLTAQPEAVADRVFKAANGKQNVIYVKPVWRVVMTVIRTIPEGIFKKLSL
jgi:decaprenylphospho-beta-D-erythro-pentofuranosid-2-ulose 2-reductase